jgi:hypothetical protein
VHVWGEGRGRGVAGLGQLDLAGRVELPRRGAARGGAPDLDAIAIAAGVREVGLHDGLDVGRKDQRGLHRHVTERHGRLRPLAPDPGQRQLDVGGRRDDDLVVDAVVAEVRRAVRRQRRLVREIAGGQRRASQPAPEERVAVAGFIGPW